MRSVLAAALVLALIPAATASAVTPQEIVALTRAGVSEPIILALIERDKTIYTIGAEQLLALQKEGLSDTIILAMIRSGRQEPPPEAAPAPPPPVALPDEPPEPEIASLSQRGDRPESPDGYYNHRGGAPSVVPYFIAVPYAVPARGLRAHRSARALSAPAIPFSVTAPLAVVPPGHAASVPGVTGIFFTSPAARGIFFDQR